MLVMFSSATSMVRAGYWLIRWLERTRPNVKGNVVVFGLWRDRSSRNMYSPWDCVLSEIFMCGCGGDPLWRYLVCWLSSW